MVRPITSYCTLPSATEASVWLIWKVSAIELRRDVLSAPDGAHGVSGESENEYA